MEIFCCGGGRRQHQRLQHRLRAHRSSFHVLIAYSDIEGPPATLQSQILAEPGVTGVDLFDASSATPTLAQLQPYNIVVAFSNNPYADAVAMGNVLADYADTGGIVVGLNFDWFGPPFGLDGRWITGGYTPFNIGPDQLQHQLPGHLRYDPPADARHLRRVAVRLFPPYSHLESWGGVGRDVSGQSAVVCV